RREDGSKQVRGTQAREMGLDAGKGKTGQSRLTLSKMMHSRTDVEGGAASVMVTDVIGQLHGA
ncbi:MAG: hypothetical protein AAF658_22575, partial [Myxococcota bacterium]